MLLQYCKTDQKFRQSSAAVGIMLVLSLGLFLSMWISPSAHAATRDYDQIQAAVDSYVDNHQEDLYGLSVQVLAGDKLVAEGYYGNSNLETGRLLSSQSVFDWGQASEILVWVSVYQLVEQGKLDLEADIRKYLPKDFKLPLRFDQHINLHMLMSYTAGFDDAVLDVTMDERTQGLSLREALEIYPVQQVYAPKTLVSRSSYASALAAYIVSLQAQEDYDEYVKRHIFEPLRMYETGFLNKLSENSRIYTERKEQSCYTNLGLELGPCMRNYTLYPSLSLVGSSKDMLRLVRGLLNLSSESLFETEETYNNFWRQELSYAHSGEGRVTSGFMRLPTQEELWYIKGNSLGMSVVIEVNPKEKIAVITASNVRDDNKLLLHIPNLVFSRLSQQKSENFEDASDFVGVYQLASAPVSGPTKFMSILTRKIVSAYQDHDLKINNKVYEQLRPGYYMNAKASQDEYVYSFVRDVSYGSLLLTPQGDAYRISFDNFVLEMILLVLWFCSFLCSCGLSLYFMIHHIRARKRGSGFIHVRASLVLNLLHIAMSVLIGYLVFLMLNYTSSKALHPFIVCAYIYLVLSLALSGYILRDMARGEMGKKERNLKFISLMVSLIYLMNMFYWDVVF